MPRWLHPQVQMVASTVASPATMLKLQIVKFGHMLVLCWKGKEMGLHFMKNNGFLPLHPAMAENETEYPDRGTASSAIVPEASVGMVNINEELAAVATWWTLNDFLVIPPPPEFDNSSMESVMGSLAGLGTVPCPPKGGAWFGQTGVYVSDYVLWPGPREVAAAPLYINGINVDTMLAPLAGMQALLYLVKGRAHYRHGLGLPPTDDLP